MAAPNFPMVNDYVPAEFAAAVTPNDGADLSQVTRFLYVGGAGNISLDMSDGTTTLFSGIVAGSILPLRVKRVRATSTTATNIVALY